MSGDLRGELFGLARSLVAAQGHVQVGPQQDEIAPVEVARGCVGNIDPRSEAGTAFATRRTRLPALRFMKKCEAEQV